MFPDYVLLAIDALVYLLLTALVFWLLDRLERRVAGLHGRVRTLASLFANSVRWLVGLGLFLALLDRLGVDVSPLLAGAGVVGVALTIGSQSLVKDVVSGAFLMAENQLAVGDAVQVNGISGVVEEVGLRLTRLRETGGAVCYIPNGAITQVINYTRRPVQALLTVPLPAEGGEQACQVVLAAVRSAQEQWGLLGAGEGQPQTLELCDGTRVLRLVLELHPLGGALTSQRLPGRISAALRRAGLPVPEEPTVTPLLNPSDVSAGWRGLRKGGDSG
jgi:small conductance mechanosensitive channel